MDPTFGRDYYEFSENSMVAKKKEETIRLGSCHVRVERERFCGLPSMKLGRLKLAFSMPNSGSFGIVSESNHQPSSGVFVDDFGESEMERIAGDSWVHMKDSVFICEVNFES